jgi:hypothetical protein
MEVSSQLHAPTSLTPGKEPLVPLDRRLVGPQSRSGRSGEEKNSQPLPGIEPPIIQPVAQRYTTELSWFPNPITTRSVLILSSHLRLSFQSTLLFEAKVSLTYRLSHMCATCLARLILLNLLTLIIFCGVIPPLPNTPPWRGT